MSAPSSNTVDLAAQTYGDAGGPIIILHGLLGSGRNWTSIAKRLAQTRKVVTLDLRNHGGSPWADEMTYPLMAADVRSFIERTALGPVTLIGHSMGGKTAMRLALGAPSLIERLVVVDIAPADYEHGFGAYVEAMQAIDVAALSSRGEVDDRLAATVPEAPVRAFLLQNLVRQDQGFSWRPNLDALASAMPALMSFPKERRDHFAGPALFLAGAESNYVKPVDREGIETLFPRADIRTIADAGHWLHAEQPTAFMAHVQQFLAS